MRIISGDLKGQRILPPEDKNTRPLRDLVKESIFNLLEHSRKIKIKLENSEVLDLFSGSGSFGIECISRGAKKVIFFENYSEALNILKKNIKLLKINEYFEIVYKDCFNYFNSNQTFKDKFDIIFIDPPYKEIKINELIDRIIEKRLLKKNGIIIIHRHKNDIVEITKKLKVFENRKYGLSNIFFGN